MLDKLKGYKTFIFFFAVSMLGVLAMLDAERVQSFLLPLMCHVTALPADIDPCTARVIKITGAIVSAVGVIGTILRFITTSAIFAPDNSKGSVFLLPLFLVALAGLSLNGYQAEKEGRPVTSVKILKDNVKHSLHNVQPKFKLND